MRLFLCLFLSVLLIASCGQKAPLYFRDSPPAGVKPPKPEPYRPLPYPKEPAKDATEGEGDTAGKK